MKVIAFPLLLCFLLSQTLSAEPGVGTICVAPNSAKKPTLISPGGDYNPATLLLKIDKRQTVLWPHKGSLKIEGLDLQGRHLVVVTSDGKRIQSFWFRFADYQSQNICIAFDGYQGVELQANGSLWCKCR